MTYTMRGPDLYDTHNRKIAVTRGAGIYDRDNRRVATIRGNNLFDSDDRKLMTVRGSFIYDAGNKRVASLVEAEDAITGASVGMLSVALWYCFIR
ncbi:MAG: 4-fold beta flower protein [Bacteroidota bacterium]